MQLNWRIITAMLLWHMPLLSTAQQRDSSTTFIDSLVQPYTKLLKAKPGLRITGGYAAYNFNFRSNIDTPYVERNLAQHQLTGQLDLVVANVIPLQVNYWLRKSNSGFFRDIADVQVSFNSGLFRNQLQSVLRDRFLKLQSNIVDSATEKLYALKDSQLNKLRNFMNIDFSEQAIAEAHEILQKPRISWDPYLPEDVNKKREDSIARALTFLLKLYEKTKGRYDSLHHEVDSLKKLSDEGLQKIERFKNLVNGGWKDFASLKQLETQLEKYGLNKKEIPQKYRWLMGIRRLSLGRSVGNYSELTAKNISVNGLNFEYNSWYYFAVMAGTVNFHFRDFVVNNANRKPQTMIMVRGGIGALERNYFILSAYRGQKQLFSGTAANRKALVDVSGISAESRWQLNRSSWLTAEVAKSIVPDFRNIPSQGKARLDFSDRSSQAMAFRLYTFIPQTHTRVEAFYKHTGANFQSFSSFQTNADMESWYIKAEQAFFKRKLRIAGALRKNEFVNPFIVQHYKSNTIFKSISASLRMRKWPAITVAYQPMSQLTHVGDHVAENRFQSLNATLYHLYKVSTVRTASTVMFNKFYNNSSDSGFIYYNATNFYWTQHFLFNSFTTHIGASHTKNSGYMLNVLDGGITPQFKKLGSVGAGVRVNSFNDEVIKVGGYVNANIKINKRDILFINYEHGYLPGLRGTLVMNEMATVQFTKIF